jgi:uncharacterized protein
MILVLKLLLLQTLMGAFDTVWHHEITERLPSRRAAATELALHALREFLYACTFIALAWYEWRGGWVVLLGAVLLAEIVVTVADFIVEDRTRRLPAAERALHTVLAINMGVILAVFAPVLLAWWQLPSAVVATSYGALSWIATLLATGVFIWFVRNCLAVLRHRRPPHWVREPLAVGQSPSARVVLVSGATGFIGTHLVRRLLARGEKVIVLTRDADKAMNQFGPHVTVATSLRDLQPDIRVDAIVNLAGEPIMGWPWTRRRRHQLLASRLAITRELVQFAASLTRAPRVLISASAIGYYGVRGDESVDESAASQAVFQSWLCQQWEEAASAAEGLGTRVVRLRIGLVLGRDGGVLPQLVRPARCGLGAVLGTGRQWVSWIHIDDLIRLVEFALDKPAIHGALNAVAPGAATQLQLQHALTHALHRPLWLRVPAFVLRTVLGEMAQLLVDGQRVMPARALAWGFVFRHAQLPRALADLLAPAGLQVVVERATKFYFNGECPVCSVEMHRYERHCAATGTQVHFVDATRQPHCLTQYGLRPEHLERRVYLLDPDGRIVSGLPALIELWSRMPGYGWLAKLFSLPLLHPVAATLYDHVVAPSLAWWARRRLRSRASVQDGACEPRRTSRDERC